MEECQPEREGQDKNAIESLDSQSPAKVWIEPGASIELAGKRQ